MAKESRLGQMEQSTSANGEKIELTERASSSMLMETSMMVNGLMIKQTASEHTCM